ncbi:MAG: hypothetical protein HYX51_00525 [Chloroflexi bacterium]|nr:hypothetical protein [Chloroflexota bacterium]
MSIQQLYDETIRALPVDERIRLASLIMWESAGTGNLDYREEWSDEDLREFTAAGWKLIERRLNEEGEDDKHGFAG